MDRGEQSNFSSSSSSNPPVPESRAFMVVTPACTRSRIHVDSFHPRDRDLRDTRSLRYLFKVTDFEARGDVMEWELMILKQNRNTESCFYAPSSILCSVSPGFMAISYEGFKRRRQDGNNGLFAKGRVCGDSR